jgi:hypothetical protein
MSILCILSLVALGEKVAPGPKSKPLLKLSEKTIAGDDYQSLIDNLCKDYTIASIWTESYYLKKNIYNKENIDKVKDARAITVMLSDIAQLYIEDKIITDDAVDLLKKLDKMDRRILNVTPKGSVNIGIHNQISLLISGLTIALVSEAQTTRLNELTQYHKQRDLEKILTDRDFINSAKDEIGGFDKVADVNDLLLSTVLLKEIDRRYKEDWSRFQKEFQKEPASLEDIAAMDIMRGVSKRIPYHEYNLLDQTSEYFVYKEKELLSRLAIKQNILKLKYRSDNDMDSYKEDFMKSYNEIFGNEPLFFNVTREADEELFRYVYSQVSGLNGKELLNILVEKRNTIN